MPQAATPATADLKPSIDLRVLAEKSRAIQSNVPSMMNGYVLCAWFASWMLFDVRNRWAIWLWLGSVTVSAGLNVRAGLLAKKYRTKPHRAQRRLTAATWGALFFGVQWSVGLLLLWPAHHLDLQVFLMFLTVGLALGSLLSISVHLPAFHAYFLPCIGSLLVATVHENQQINYLMAVATVVYLMACLRFVKTLSETFVTLMRTRFEMDDLAERLKQQKEVAEEASLSKSRFLAAASHDLRQPVHSLALFAGTLSGYVQGPEGERVLGHMRTTIDSLSNMFNALLNISKLDAKVVQPQWACIDLQHLLQNVCDAECAEAHQKGLFLRLNSTPLWVQTDRVLLDRIVRNLVSNAVRYTDQGGVLISARVRAGQVWVRVWDTGLGIPADKHAEIFQEFVQLHNPERDRNNGLGLGLAIVWRLTHLLHMGVTLKSTQGRGSVFTLGLGAAQPAPVRYNPDPPVSPLPTLAVVEKSSPSAVAVLVIVIDDDAMIRLSTSALLRRWGYEVVAVGGLAELEPLIATGAQAPQLVISDLRLRNGENGIETVEYLRTVYNDDLPALLITGDTDPERLRQAQASGLLLLHKPVSPDVLQAAILQMLMPMIEAVIIPVAGTAAPPDELLRRPAPD